MVLRVGHISFMCVGSHCGNFLTGRRVYLFMIWYCRQGFPPRGLGGISVYHIIYVDSSYLLHIVS